MPVADSTDAQGRPRALADNPEINPYADPSLPGAATEPIENLQALKVFTIPSTAGDVTLYGPEIGVVKTKTFQRLGFIKQLGTSYMVYRGALHTRFEHSLGTLHMADKIVQAARRNPSLPAKEAQTVLNHRNHRLARLAALLHDVVHVPFGHTLEDEFGLLHRHDENDARVTEFFGPPSKIADVLVPIIGEDEYKELVAVLRAKKDEEIQSLDHPFLADIVGNTVCADLLDYVRRDLEACGMEMGIGERFLGYFTVTDEEGLPAMHRSRMALVLDKRGMPRPDLESEVVKLLTFRYELAERVYFHHAKNAASVMIARAVHALGLATGPEPVHGKDVWRKEEERNFWSLSDELLLRILADPDLATKFNLSVRPAADRDDGLIGELGRRLLERDVYKLAYLGVLDDLSNRAHGLYDKWGKPERRIDLEDKLAAAAGLGAGWVLVHLPRPQMMQKRADVRVILGDRHVVTTLNDWDRGHSRRIESLNAAHERLWRVGVYLHPEAYKDASRRRLVRAAAEEEFGARSRYEVERPIPYIEAVWEAEAALHEDWPAASRREVLDHLRSQRVAAFTGVPSLNDTAELIRQEMERRKNPDRLN